MIADGKLGPLEIDAIEVSHDITTYKTLTVTYYVVNHVFMLKIKSLASYSEPTAIEILRRFSNDLLKKKIGNKTGV